MNDIFLYPGQIATLAEAGVIRTLLGSCVSVALGDKTRGIAGLCHYLLDVAQPPHPAGPRYGDFAVPELLRQLKALGAQDIKAKLYGGAHVTQALSGIGGEIGQRNIAIATRILQQLRIPITDQNVGGSSARSIRLSPIGFVVECRISSDPSSAAFSTSGRTVVPPKTEVRVLVVDDSATVRTIFTKALNRCHGITVVGSAVDPYDAREKIVKLKPDVMTLDIEMPRMNGVDFLEKIMIHHPMPVVMVSSLSADGAAALRALQLGAVEFVHKPSQFDPSILGDLAELLGTKILAAAALPTPRPKVAASTRAKTSQATPMTILAARLELICIGGNIGADKSLIPLLKDLPQDSCPVVVAIPTIAQFAAAFAKSLENKTAMRVAVARSGDLLKEGCAYLLPGQVNGTIHKSGSHYSINLTPVGKLDGQSPSVDRLLNSAAAAAGANGCAILLSGFGAVGADGLQSIREAGGLAICEDPESAHLGQLSIHAIERGAVDLVLEATAMAEAIRNRRNAAVLSRAS